MDRRDGRADSAPLDAGAALALAARVRREIDDAGDQGRDLLLTDILCAAWPSSTAQDQ
jgi:hypothetical protein